MRGVSGFKDHFSAGAALYAVHRPGYPRQLADFLAGLSPGCDLALDCGCGSGQLSVLLAERFARVIATDASAEQIAHAVAHPRVRYRCAPAERSGLADASCDLVAAAQAAHWFDLDAFYAEVRRIARPGGGLALISYGLIEIEGEVGALVHRFYGQILGPYWPAERRLVDDGYRSLPFPFREVTPPAMALSASWTLPQLKGYIATWSALAPLRRALGDAPGEAFFAALAAAWGAPETARDVRWPLAIRAGRL